VRVHQDPLSGELALAANARSVGLAGSYRSLGLDGELGAGARVVLLQLPRSLAALEEVAALIARCADPDVVVFAGGRVKHMTTAMSDVLRRHFGQVSASLARQKSRVLRAEGPIADEAPTDAWPRREFHADLGLWVCAHGAAFAGTSVDIGTRFLLEFLPRMKADATSAIDLGCGTGLLGAALAVSRPSITVVATDQSAAAVASAQATMEANGVVDRVAVMRDDALGRRPTASAELIVLNPPFHIGASVHAGIALKLFEDAARVLEPGGELWTVWNSHLSYRPALSRIVGPTEQAGRNAKFTVTVSTRR
jgi:16S rRNA (guanine1207-N2)-methyltransferase